MNDAPGRPDLAADRAGVHRLSAPLSAVEASRRSFLGGALALVAATALPLDAFATAPVIVGDGVHDDTLGLQSAVDGKPFRVRGGGALVMRRHGKIFIGGGAIFRLTKTLDVGDHCDLTLENAEIDGSEIENQSFLMARGKVTIRNCILRTVPISAEQRANVRARLHLLAQGNVRGVTFDPVEELG